MTTEPYEVVVTRPAARAISEELPEEVAAAAIEFIVGPLRHDPTLLG